MRKYQGILFAALFCFAMLLLLAAGLWWYRPRRLLFGQNDGVLRGYAVAGVLGGMVFYDRTGSRLLFAVLKKCSGWIKMKRRGKKSQKTGKKRTTRGQAENMERK